MPTSISRRRFLRGVGVAMSLPWLESLPVWASGDRPPVRYACIYFGNGVGDADRKWWARGEGETMEFSEILAPLARVKGDIFVPMGLNQQGHTGSENHVRKCPTYLSHGPVGVATDLAPLVRQTIDQMMANAIGHATPVSSLALGVEPVFPGTNAGLSYAAAGNISWMTPTSPLPKEVFPALAFDKIVGAGERSRHDQSVLDLVLEDARQLRGAVSGADRRQIDDYLQSVRDVETRIRRVNDRSQPAGWAAPIYQESMMRRPATDLPAELADHMRLMLDLVVLAFRINSTRIATLMLNNEISRQRFDFLPGVGRGDLHGISHGNRVEQARINLFMTELFADFVAKLKDTHEADGSLLDNCLIQYGCCMWTGGHNAPQLPLVLAGRGGQTIRTGRAVDYSQRANRDLSQLYLSIMDRMGVRLDRFGPTSERLPDLA